MLIGIVADIHDAAARLRKALSIFDERGVARVVTVGDAFETFLPGEPGAEVAGLLENPGAIGVWGNHDFGLSCDVPEEIRREADPGLLAFASGLGPQLVIEGCRFCHIEPWKDPSRFEDLWTFEGVPETAESARRSFDAVPERLLFCRALSRLSRHRRRGRSRVGRDASDRSGPACAIPDPGARRGLRWCATFDTVSSKLSMIRCAA